jgi:hypothetical protein
MHLPRSRSEFAGGHHELWELIILLEHETLGGGEYTGRTWVFKSWCRGRGTVATRG